MRELPLSEPPSRSRQYARDSRHPIDLAVGAAERRQATARTAAAQGFRVVPQGSTFWARPGVPHPQSAPSDAATGIPSAGMARRIVAAFRSWRQRDHSWDDLRGLNDSVLKDIGLRREDLGRSCIQPYRYID
jgi:uncharacterized protein YjiS (DUF1127 family)